MKKQANGAAAPLLSVVAQSSRYNSLEQTFEPFYDRTIDAARNGRSDVIGPARLMTEMNHMYTTLLGLSVVMRMVAANSVLEENYDPEDLESEPPLSQYNVGAIEGMVASVCEMLTENISSSASFYNDKVK